MVVAILASGPSMNPNLVEQVRAAGLRSFVINDTFRLMPDADVLFASDHAWWNANPEAHEFAGEKYVSEPAQMQGVRYITPRPPKAGGNSALRAAHLAEDQGAKTILLLGVDLNDEALTHWHGQHPAGLHNPNLATFERAREAWGCYAWQLQRPDVINCNPESGLHCFPKMTLADALEFAHA